MSKAVDLLKKAIGIHPQQGVQPLRQLVHVGSAFHGYHLPENFLTPDSVCYCIGAGEDISFDTELCVLYGAKVYIFDPTPEGIEHFNKLKDSTLSGQPMTIHTSVPFTYRITGEQLNTIQYVPIGVWNETTTLKFFAPDRDNYASHSVYLFKDSGNYIEAPVDRLSNLMKTLGHTAIDVVKMEIEGAEYAVIDTIVQDRIDVKIILVEFDEVFNSTDKTFHLRIKKACTQLKRAGYVLVHSTDNMKRTFIRGDVYATLKAQELE